MHCPYQPVAEIGFVWRDCLLFVGWAFLRQAQDGLSPIAIRAEIGFVLSTPWAGPIYHNSFRTQYLPLSIALAELALFRTIALPGTPISGSA